MPVFRYLLGIKIAGQGGDCFFETPFWLPDLIPEIGKRDLIPKTEEYLLKGQ